MVPAGSEKYRAVQLGVPSVLAQVDLISDFPLNCFTFDLNLFTNYLNWFTFYLNSFTFDLNLFTYDPNWFTFDLNLFTNDPNWFTYDLHLHIFFQFNTVYKDEQGEVVDTR